MTSPVPTAPADRHVVDASRSWNGADTQARTIANVVLISAGVAAACVVLANPTARRVAQRVVRNWLGASVPMYLLAQAGRAWVEAGRRA